MNKDKLFRISLKRGNIIYDNLILLKNKYIIIDFYNIYCSLIEFNKYKFFSKETFILCVEKIVNSFIHEPNIYIVSKEIFEISLKDIETLTNKYPHLTYIRVTDNFKVKSHNKERDDYACILIHNTLKTNGYPCVLVSNDTFSNYPDLIKNVKPFTLEIIKKGFTRSINYNTLILKNNNLLHYKEEIEKVKFKFKKQRNYKK